MAGFESSIKNIKQTTPKVKNTSLYDNIGNYLVETKKNAGNTDVTEIDLEITKTVQKRYNKEKFGELNNQTFVDEIEVLNNEPRTSNISTDKQKEILEKIQPYIDSSVENKVKVDFNAECQYKFGVDISKLDTLEETEQVKQFKSRVNGEKEYWADYYKWYYYTQEIGEKRDYNANYIDLISDHKSGTSYISEAATFQEFFKNETYKDMMEFMTEDEKAYWNYQFRIKYAEIYYSEEYRNGYQTDKARIMNAMYEAVKEVDKMFGTQSFQVKTAQQAAFRRIDDKYDLKKVKFDESNEISINEFLNSIKEGNEQKVIMHNGKFYKYPELEENEVMIQDVNGNYYTYEVDNVDEFFKWFGEGLGQEPFNIMKGFGSIFTNNSDLNKAFYEDQIMKDEINQTTAGSVGYGFGTGVADIGINTIFNCGSIPNALFWCLSAYGSAKKRKLQSGSSLEDARLTGAFEGGNAFFFSILSDLV